MALPDNHPLSELQVVCHSASIGGSPAAAYVRAPFRGKVLKLGVVAGGVITTADATVATAINGTAITGGSITLPVAGAAAGQHASAAPTAANNVEEDGVISFTPSGASGSSIPGSFYAVVRRA
jgi:hypothetical protein